MKKVILSVAAVFAFGFANAQEKETTGEGFASGDVFILGSAGFGSTETGDQKTSTFNFSPRAAYFVSPNIAVGLAVGFEGTKDEDVTVAGPVTTETEVKTGEFSIGAFGRYYFTPASKFSVFGELGFNVTGTKTENDTRSTVGGTTTTTNSEIKSNGFNIGLAPGISYFISNSFALEAKWGLLEYTTTEPDAPAGVPTESTDTFNLGLNFDNLSIGLLYKF